jgi:CTP synthase
VRRRREAVAAAVDAPSIYDIPKVLHSEGLDAYVIRRLGLGFRDVNWTSWDEMLRRVHDPAHQVEVALVGKYIDLPDAYLSVTEALRAGGFHHNAKVTVRWVASDECATPAGAQKALQGVDAVLVPGGFGVRGIEGKLGALTWARERQVPTLGLCLGCSAWSSNTPARCRDRRCVLQRVRPADHPPGHRDDGRAEGLRRGAGDLGGTMRLGRYAAHLSEGSVVATAYGQTEVEERHRHRYEVNNAYRDQLAQAGLVFSGTSPDGSLVEFVELPADVHPYYVATQAHPGVPLPAQPAHPLFAGLIGAALDRQRGERLVEVEVD